MEDEQQHDKTPQPLCSMCNRLGLHQCNGCMCIRYCSSQCQKDDWKTHKLICKSYSKFMKSAKSGGEDNQRVGIFFPEDDGFPHFTKIVVHKVETNNGHIGIFFSFDDAPEYDYSSAASLQVWNHQTTNLLLNRPMPSALILVGRLSKHNKAYIEGQFVGKPNKAVRLLSTELSNSFKGPLLIMSEDRDLDATDFRHAVDNLGVFHWSFTHNRLEDDSPPYKWAHGVKVNCEGDRVRFRRGDFFPARADVSLIVSEPANIEPEMH
jgi:hypothetical protein